MGLDVALNGHEPQAEAPPEAEGWSVNRLASELRLDRRTVTKRLAAMAPIAQGAKGPLYDLGDAARALFGQAGLAEMDALKGQILESRAEAAHLDLAAKRGELVPAAEVRKVAETNARIEREALLNWPDHVASMLAAEPETEQATLTAAL